MASKNNQVLETNHVLFKKFSYKMGTLSLEFTLDISSQSTLRSYIEILESAVKDLEAQISQGNKTK